MSSNVLIIYTGGTIGMQMSDDGYVPVAGFEALLRERLNAGAAMQLPNFEVLEFEHLIDSSNLQPQHWNKIAAELQANWDRYDGFIVLHGTDTMAYSASALSYMMQGLDKPVIFTGSQIPLTELRNDALDNLLTALILAGNYPLNEVSVFFNGRLLRGNRSSKLKSTGFDAFDSPNFPWLGQAGIHIDLHRHLLLSKREQRFTNPEFAEDTVRVLPVYPGISAAVARDLLAPEHVKGLIMISYGVGNPPDANTELMDILAEATARGVVIVNLTHCLQGRVSQGAYATGQTLNKIGVLPGSDLTLEAAFTKLHFLLATEPSTDDVRRLMAESVCGELSG
ncbi:asparaginase [Aliamphritea spongicola]|uniref:asparaginase n=1 Tax=Aliamphritea spongicola TaxID=707589 RepID=UPI00196B0271|nr:asparaginase [Aliamphritea spongicola]MBN3563339.1 asparaginase [Aliamphritea spongicola]